MSETSSLHHYKPVTILLYGASSFTAKMSLAYLKDHPQKSQFTFALGGRTRSKLEEVKEELGLTEDVWVFKLEDDEVIERAVGSCEVVMNFAGPFGLYNAEALVRACSKLGKHYVDLTGEPGYVVNILKYDYLASTTGACIVPSCGFDSIPSDLSAFLSAQYLASTSGSSTANVATSELFLKMKAGMSGGTMTTAISLAEMSPHEKAGKKGEFAMCINRTGKKSPKPKLWYYNSIVDWYGGFFFMTPHNMKIVRRSWNLLQYPPAPTRSLISTNSIHKPLFSYGEDFTYSECLVLGSRKGKGSLVKSVLLTIALAIGGALFAGSKWVRNFAAKRMPSGSGPDEDLIKNGWLDLVNVATTSDEPPRVAVTTLYGKGDPGYSQTARWFAECALALTLDHSQLPYHGQQGGVLTPATSMGDVLRKRLVTYTGLEISTTDADGYKKKVAESKKTV